MNLLASASKLSLCWSWLIYQVRERVIVWPGKCGTDNLRPDRKCQMLRWILGHGFIFQNENVWRADAIHSQLWITFQALFDQDIISNFLKWVYCENISFIKYQCSEFWPIRVKIKWIVVIFVWKYDSALCVRLNWKWEIGIFTKMSTSPLIFLELNYFR